MPHEQPAGNTAPRVPPGAGEEPTETMKPHPPTHPDLMLLHEGEEPVPGYRLTRKVGQGGFGEVWQAEGPGGFSVALKFIRLAEGGTVELRSLEIMKQIRHPHLLPMFGAWQKRDFLIVAMELARCTLSDRLKELVAKGQPGIPVPELTDHLRDAARALDYLNEQNIQHRDVKPHNLMLVGDGVKLADFGLAKVLEHTAGPASGSMTPTYAAPELFDHQVTRWSDQYSLAITYCQLRGNTLPFKGSPVQLMFGHLQREPNLAMLPENERPVVARALAKKPEDRWPNCRQFAEALAGLAAPPMALAGRSEPLRSDPQVVLRPFELYLKPPAPFRVKPGSQPTFPVQVERGHCPGKLEVRLAGLPSGITFHSEGIPAEAVEGRLMLTVTADAKPWEGKVRLLVRGAAQADLDVPLLIEPLAWPAGVSNHLGMKLALVPAGAFLMGSPQGEDGRRPDEDPRHEVEITRPFYLGVHPVTQTQFEQVMGYNPAFFTRERGGGPEHPVEQVSWAEAVAFCQRLSDLPQERQALRSYRLPTEAEWEYACRAGLHAATGFGPALNSTQANFNGNAPFGNAAKGTYRMRTTKIGTFKPNGWGLCDMHGNVGEWCSDWYDAHYYSYSYKRDPKGGDSNAGSRRVTRGGSWIDPAHLCRAACRGHRSPEERLHTVGFRVVLELVPGMGC